MDTFFNSQLNYCLLVWMFHSRTFNNNINKLHETCLRLKKLTKKTCIKLAKNLHRLALSVQI